MSILIEVFVSDADCYDFEGRFRRHFPRTSNDFALVMLKGPSLAADIAVSCERPAVCAARAG
jgi:hypothetical protein